MRWIKKKIEMFKEVPKRDLVGYVLLFLYFLSISAFRLGDGFDAVFVRVVFVAMVIFYLLRKRRLVVSDVLIWGLVFWVFYFLSALWASNVGDVFDRMVIFVQVLGIFVFVPAYIKDSNTLVIVLKILLASLVLTAGVALVRNMMSGADIRELGKAVGLNPNMFGLRMAVAVIISLSMFHLEKKKTKLAWVYLLIMPVLAAFALLSGSRKALVLIIFGVIGYEVLFARGVEILWKIVGGLALTALVVTLIFSNAQLYNTIGYRVEKAFSMMIEQDGTVDNSLRERNFYIERGMELFGEHPVLGYGGNNFKSYMRESNYKHVAYSHNNFVEILSTLGIVGFSIYYSIWVITLWRIVTILLYERKNKMRNPNTILCLVVTVVLLILDYGMVSYLSDFNMVMLCLIYMYGWNRKREIGNGLLRKEIICQ